MNKKQDAENMILKRLCDLAEKHKTTVMKIAIAWSFTQKGIEMPVISTENSGEAIQGMRPVLIQLDSEDVRYLKEVLCIA